MHELTPDGFKDVLPLLEDSPMRGHLAFPFSVVEGRHPGRILVDRTIQPRTAVVCDLTGFFFAFGEPDEIQAAQIIDFVRQNPLTGEATALFGTSPAWDALLRRIFLGIQDALPEASEAAYAGGYRYKNGEIEVGIQTPVRIAFAYRPSPGRPPEDWKERIPPGFRLEPISEAMGRSILDGSGTGGFGIDPWFIRIAGGPAAYAAQGLGMALMDGDQIASLCGYCALGHGEAEMELGTPPAYRGRGLAVLVSLAFIEQCREQGWEPAYSSDSRNKASIAVAGKLGFEEMERILGFRLY